MDEITKAIDELTNKVIVAINESGLHPRVVGLILANILSQLQTAQQNNVQETVEE